MHGRDRDEWRERQQAKHAAHQARRAAQRAGRQAAQEAMREAKQAMRDAQQAMRDAHRAQLPGHHRDRYLRRDDYDWDRDWSDGFDEDDADNGRPRRGHHGRGRWHGGHNWRRPPDFRWADVRPEDLENWPWAREPRDSPGGAAIGSLLILVATTLLFFDDQRGYQPLEPAAWFLLVASALALGARRRLPRTVALLVTVTASAYYLLGYPPGLVFIPQLIALHAVVTSGRRGAAWGIALLGYVGFVVADHTIAVARPLPVTLLAAAAAWTALTLVSAEAGRAVRERGTEAARRRLEAAQRREEAERRQVSEERLRIAREVHDLLGHHLSLISVQAGVALHLMDSRTPEQERPEDRTQLRTALAAIKTASKDALVELRSTVSTLRRPDEDLPRQPAPTLTRLADLVTAAESGGLTITTETVGEPVEIPSRVDLAAFRIIQESLTNVRKHAGPVPATITIDYGADTLCVQVEDAGPAEADVSDEPSEGGGNGIPGMRERAESVGGQLWAGPRPEGGFRVRAELPLKDNG